MLLYDGACGFCRACVRRWQARTGNRVEYLPYQEADGRFAGVAATELARAVHLIEPDGRRTSAAQAVFRLLGEDPVWRWLGRLYESLPAFACLAESVYRFVASRRRCLAWPHRR